MIRFLSKQQTDFIKSNFLELSFVEREPSRQAFEKIETPAQLHYLADMYNWDDGTEVLDWIISSPACDKGTALLLFWRAEPDYYTRFNDESEADIHKETFSLLRKIVTKWQTGFFKKERFSYNPMAEGYDVEYRYPNEKWAIPHEMKQPTSGSIVIGVDDVQAVLVKGFKSWWVRLKRIVKSKKRRKKSN